MKADSKRYSTYRGLQALRFLAAVLVVILHSTLYVRERLQSGFPLWGPGVNGVDIFFVLSGFVMIYSSGSLRNDPQGWRIFAERRIVRIVPMYWIATSLKLAAVLLTSGFVLHARFDIWKTLCSYFFIPARNVDGELEPLLGVGWTLNFEMFFYAIFTFALFLQKNVYQVCGSFLLLLATGAYFRAANWPPVSFYLDTIVLEFFFGMLIAKACLIQLTLPVKLAIPMLAVSLFVLTHPWPAIAAPRALMIGVPAAMLVWSTASLESIFVRLPQWLVYLGDASFMIYLFHPMTAPFAPTIFAKYHLFYPQLAVLASLAIALTVGCVVHEYLELPITKLFRDLVRVRGQKMIHLPQMKGLEGSGDA